MSDYAQPALFALFLWWFSTGVILYLDRRHPSTFKWSMAGATLILAASLWGLARSSTDTSRLTRREHEVLEMIAKGFSYAETSQICGIAAATVHSHLKSI